METGRWAWGGVGHNCQTTQISVGGALIVGK